MCAHSLLQWYQRSWISSCEESVGSGPFDQIGTRPAPLRQRATVREPPPWAVSILTPNGLFLFFIYNQNACVDFNTNFRILQTAPQLEFQIFKNPTKMAKSYHCLRVNLSRLLMQKADEEGGVQFVREVKISDSPGFVHEIPSLPTTPSYFIIAMLPPPDIDWIWKAFPWGG